MSDALTAPMEATPRQGHPPGLFLLFFVEMWERFSYYGMRAILVLYLISTVNANNPGPGWTRGEANLLYGWYTGLVYLLTLAGGFLADKFLGTHRSMVVGALLITMGHIVLGVTGIESLANNPLGMSLFMGGLALIILGTGYFKPCVSVMVGQLYPPGDPRRDGGFTIFYMGINLGAFICAFVCGTLGEKVGWHWGFGSAAVGMILGLITYLIGRPYYLKGIGLPPEGASNSAPWLFFLATFALAGGYTYLYHTGSFGAGIKAIGEIFTLPIVGTMLQLGVMAGVLGASLWLILIQKPGERGQTASIFIFMLFNVFFWIAFEQAGSVLNTFALDNTDRTIAALDTEVPATWFQSINPLLIVALAPFFAAMWTALGKRNLDPSQPTKIGLGLLLLGGGYIFIFFAARLNATGIKVGMFWLVACYSLHTLGELCLSPTGLAYVTKAAPIKYMSLLMGIWMISSFLANLGGGIVASYVEDVEKGTIPLPWNFGGLADYFFLFVVTSFGGGLLILILVPLLRPLLPADERGEMPKPAH